MSCYFEIYCLELIKELVKVKDWDEAYIFLKKIFRRHISQRKILSLREWGRAEKKNRTTEQIGVRERVFGW